MEQQSSLVVLASFSLPVVCCVPPLLFLRENSYKGDLQCACIFCLSCPQGSYKKSLIRTGYHSLLFQDPNFASLFLVIADTLHILLNTQVTRSLVTVTVPYYFITRLNTLHILHILHILLNTRATWSLVTVTVPY